MVYAAALYIATFRDAALQPASYCAAEACIRGTQALAGVRAIWSACVAHVPASVESPIP